MIDDPRLLERELELRLLIRYLFKKLWIILIFVFTFSVGGVFYALSLPNMYKSETLVAPVAGTGVSPFGNISSQLGGLANIAGVNIPSGPANDKKAIALKTLESREFIKGFIVRHDLIVPVMATIGWNLHENELVYDSKVYDVKSDNWVRDVSAPLTPEPSLLEAYRRFSQDFLNVREDRETGFVYISIEFYSPEIAQDWANKLVKDLNDFLRERERQEAERSILFLERQLGQTSLSDLRVSLYNLIEEQMKVLMLTEVREEYVFSTIDPAIIPDLKSSPRRGLIVVLISGFSFIFSITFFVFCFFTLSKQKNTGRYAQ